MKHVLATVFFFMLATAPLPAQDFRAAMRTLQERYARLDTLHAIVWLSLFDSAATTARRRERIELRRAGDCVLYDWDGNIMLINARCQVLVSEESRTIQYMPRGQSKISAPAIANIDSLLDRYEEGVYLGRTDSVDRYTLRHSASTMVSIWLDLRSGFIRRLEYGMEHGMRTTLDFELFNPHPAFDTRTFGESRYVVIDKRSVRPARAFQGYEVNGDVGMQVE